VQCKECGYPLPAGSAFCPNCGRSTSYNTGTEAASTPVPPPPPSLAPTQLASGASYPPVPPTQVASDRQPPLAPTQVAPTQMASGASYPPVAPPPPTPGMGQSGPGWPAAPMTPPVPPLAPQPVYVPAPQQRSSCSVATILVLVVLLIIVCGGLLLGGGIWYVQTQHANATMTAIVDDANATATSAEDNATATADAGTATAQLTPTPYPPYNESKPPSGVDFSGLAQQIVPTAQMASQLNSQYEPTELQSVFPPGQKMYIAYHWVNVGYSGYVYTIWYFNGQEVTHYRSSYISTAYSYYNGYVSYSIFQDGQGAVEVYWCSKSDCSDRLLAWVRPFTISG